MLNSAIEIHDSYLGKVEVSSDDVVLWFTPAYVQKSEGEPGVDAGTGWEQEIAITIKRGKTSGEIEELPADLWDGSLEIDGIEYPNCIPLPLERKGAVRLSLVSKWSGTIVVVGTAVEIRMIGKAKYVEECPSSERSSDEH